MYASNYPFSSHQGIIIARKQQKKETIKLICRLDNSMVIRYFVDCLDATKFLTNNRISDIIEYKRLYI